jgi:hypothetical protein
VQHFLVGWDALLQCDAGVSPVDELDRVMEQLVSCEELTDPTLDYDASTKQVTFELIVEGEDLLDAMQKATSLVRSCLHAAGVGTPNWPRADEIRPSDIRLRLETAPSIELVDA